MMAINPDRPDVPPKPSRRRRILLWSGGAILLAVVAMVAVTFGTAEHWTAVDVPEQPETFTTEEYETGTHVVFPDPDAVSACRVGQDWNACVKEVAKGYKAACTDVKLTSTSDEICDYWRDWIQEQKEEDYDDYEVTSVDGLDTEFSRVALTDTRRVSNDDYRAAETHEAVCYLGFIGECDKDAPSGAAPVNEEYETGVFSIVADGENYCAKLKPKVCLAKAKAEYDQTCGDLDRAELTEASWNLCQTAGNASREEPKAKDPVGSWVVPFGHLTKVPVTAVRPVSAEPSGSGQATSASEQAKDSLRDVLNSSETTKMRAQYKEDLANGKTEEDLVAQLEASVSEGLVTEGAACVLLGLIHDKPDDVIIEDCSADMEAPLTGEGSE